MRRRVVMARARSSRRRRRRTRSRALSLQRYLALVARHYRVSACGVVFIWPLDLSFPISVAISLSVFLYF